MVSKPASGWKVHKGVVQSAEAGAGVQRYVFDTQRLEHLRDDVGPILSCAGALSAGGKVECATMDLLDAGCMASTSLCELGLFSSFVEKNALLSAVFCGVGELCRLISAWGVTMPR